jgi:chromosome segregation ATPase
MGDKEILEKHKAELKQLEEKWTGLSNQAKAEATKVEKLTKDRAIRAQAITMVESAVKKLTEAKQKKDPKFKEQDLKAANQNLLKAKVPLAQIDKDLKAAKDNCQRLKIQLDVLTKQKEMLAKQVAEFAKEVETGRVRNERFERDVFVTVEKLHSLWGDRTKLMEERIKKLGAESARLQNSMPTLIQKQADAVNKEGPGSPTAKNIQSQLTKYQLELIRLQRQIAIWEDKKNYYVKKKAEFKQTYQDKGDPKTYELLKNELKRALELKD